MAILKPQCSIIMQSFIPYFHCTNYITFVLTLNVILARESLHSLLFLIFHIFHNIKRSLNLCLVVQATRESRSSGVVAIRLTKISKLQCERHPLNFSIELKKILLFLYQVKTQYWYAGMVSEAVVTHI